MSGSFDAVVVGAGIVGAACALELARAGMRVAVVERDTIGSGATAAGMGHVVVMDDSEAQFALTKFSQSLWHNLASEFPPSVEYQRSGTIWLAVDDEEMVEVHRKFKFYSEHNLPVEVLDSRSLAEAEPKLRFPLAGGLLVTSDLVLYPPCAAAYLLARAKQQQPGIELILGLGVISMGSGRVVLQDGSVVHSPVIINASGAFAPELTPGILVKKRKGHLVITDRYPNYVRHQLVELGYLKSAHSTASDSVAFNVQPRKTGQILIGSSRQYDAEHSGIDHQIVTAMLDRATLYMPALGGLSALRVWTGFRASTPDKLPLIGPTADVSIFLATGHEGLGITTSLATARLLADHLLHRESEISIAPYLPERMAKTSAFSSVEETSHA